MSATVITPAASAMLTTTANVRMDLGLNEVAWPDQKLTRRIEQASADAVRVCRRTFGRQIYSERIYSLPCDGFALSAAPVNRIISLSIIGGAVFEPEEYAISDGLLRIQGGPGGGVGDGSSYNLWRSLQPALMVTYEAGWLLPGEEVGPTFTGQTPLPADIERAVIQLIGVAVSEAGRDATVKSDQVEGMGRRDFYVQGANAALPHPGAEATLLRYQDVVLV